MTHQVVMRNINLIVQKQPNMLQTDVRYFVCKYNDPLYVKLEKIAVMVGARVDPKDGGSKLCKYTTGGSPQSISGL